MFGDFKILFIWRGCVHVDVDVFVNVNAALLLRDKNYYSKLNWLVQFIHNIAYATFKFVAVSLYLLFCFIQFRLVSASASRLPSFNNFYRNYSPFPWHWWNSIAYIALLLCPMIIIVNSLQLLFILYVSVWKRIVLFFMSKLSECMWIGRWVRNTVSHIMFL